LHESVARRRIVFQVMTKDVFEHYPLEMFQPGSVCTYAEVQGHPKRFPHYAEVIAWIELFVMKPNPELGRAGPVCPRVHMALEQNLMKFATIRTKDASIEEAVCKCEPVVDAFHTLFPNREELPLATLLILFPDIKREQASDFIDGGHRRLRKTFIKNGLMLGEFHSHSTVPGTYNPAFRPMCAPMPFFAVRAISEHDHKFLVRPDFPAPERLECLNALLDFVGNKLESKTKAEVEAVLLELRKRCEGLSNHAVDAPREGHLRLEPEVHTNRTR
jgi:hypothetical protein